MANLANLFEKAIIIMFSLMPLDFTSLAALATCNMCMLAN